MFLEAQASLAPTQPRYVGLIKYADPDDKVHERKK